MSHHNVQCFLSLLRIKTNTYFSLFQDPSFLDPTHLPGEAELGLKGAGGSKRGSLGGSSEPACPPWRGGEAATTTDQYYAAQYDQYYRQAFNTNTDPG